MPVSKPADLPPGGGGRWPNAASGFRSARWGDLEVGFTTAGPLDCTFVYAGLPGGVCPCPHWGYVVRGKVRFTFADGHEETYEGGDAYFAPPGHLPYLFAGSEVVEFHPTAELMKTLEVVERNMAAASA